MFYGRSYSAGSCTPADGGVCLATVGLLRGAEPPRISLQSGASGHAIAEAIIDGQGWQEKPRQGVEAFGSHHRRKCAILRQRRVPHNKASP